QHAIAGDGHRTGTVPVPVRPVEHAVNHVRAGQVATHFLQIWGGNDAVERERASPQPNTAAAANERTAAESAAVVEHQRAALRVHRAGVVEVDAPLQSGAARARRLAEGPRVVEGHLVAE